MAGGKTGRTYFAGHGNELLLTELPSIWLSRDSISASVVDKLAVALSFAEELMAPFTAIELPSFDTMALEPSTLAAAVSTDLQNNANTPICKRNMPTRTTFN